MLVKELIERLQNCDQNEEVFIRNSVNVCGNISALQDVEKSDYSCFGCVEDCIILNSEHV